MQSSLLLTCLWTLAISISTLKVPSSLLFYKVKSPISLIFLNYNLWIYASPGFCPALCLCQEIHRMAWSVLSSALDVSHLLSVFSQTCKVMLSPATLQWLRCSVRLEVAYHRPAPHSLYACWWITPFILFINMPFCPMPSAPFMSPVPSHHCTIQVTPSTVLQCP